MDEEKAAEAEGVAEEVAPEAVEPDEAMEAELSAMGPGEDMPEGARA